MKFAHFADVHIGSWRDPRMNDITTKAFIKAIDICYQEKVDFILISGDFFNTSFPSIERLKETVSKLKEIKDKNIPIYVIAGSHDYSPTGKTMLDVLENAGLFINVMRGEVIDNKLVLKFTQDKKTGAKITGIVGKKGMLDRIYYENLDKTNLEAESGFKIFMFHTALTEFKPLDLEKMDSSPISLLPSGFNYYAGGHVHSKSTHELPGYSLVTFPGPLFPNNFREIEKLRKGGFYIVEGEDKVNARWIPVVIHETECFSFDCSGKSSVSVNELLETELGKFDFTNKIVLIRLEGKLGSGKLSEIDFRGIFDSLYQKGARFVMKNTASLSSPEFEEIRREVSVDEIESSIIEEHLGQSGINLSREEEKELALSLMKVLSSEKDEGEKISDFETRLLEDVKRVLKIEF